MSKDNTKKIKNFYTDDKLNKGYNKADEKATHPLEVTSENKLKEFVSKYQEMLPPLSVLAEYENLNPGILKIILSRVEDEQNQNLELAKARIKADIYMNKLGMMFSIALISIISAVSYKLAEIDKNLSFTFIIAAFSAVFLVSLFSFCAKARAPIHKKNFNTPNPQEKGSTTKKEANFEPKFGKSKRYFKPKRRKF